MVPRLAAAVQRVGLSVCSRPLPPRACSHHTRSSPGFARRLESTPPPASPIADRPARRCVPDPRPRLLSRRPRAQARAHTRDGCGRTPEHGAPDLERCDPAPESGRPRQPDAISLDGRLQGRRGWYASRLRDRHESAADGDDALIWLAEAMWPGVHEDGCGPSCGPGLSTLSSVTDHGRHPGARFDGHADHATRRRGHHRRRAAEQALWRLLDCHVRQALPDRLPVPTTCDVSRSTTRYCVEETVRPSTDTKIRQ